MGTLARFGSRERASGSGGNTATVSLAESLGSSGIPHQAVGNSVLLHLPKVDRCALRCIPQPRTAIGRGKTPAGVWCRCNPVGRRAQGPPAYWTKTSAHGREQPSVRRYRRAFNGSCLSSPTGLLESWALRDAAEGGYPEDGWPPLKRPQANGARFRRAYCFSPPLFWQHAHWWLRW